MKPNPHRGGDFDDFLKEEGIYEEVTAAALQELIKKPNTKHSRPAGMRFWLPIAGF